MTAPAGVPAIMQTRFAHVTQPPPSNGSTVKERVYALTMAAIPLTPSDDTVFVYRDESTASVMAGNGRTDRLDLEDLLSGRVAWFVLEHIFVHEDVERAELRRREIRIFFKKPLARTRLIDRHIMEGIDALNARLF